jgi:hypothetical protein
MDPLTEDLNVTNKYDGHVNRLRTVFTQNSSTSNDLKSDDHRSRYSKFSSPTQPVSDKNSRINDNNTIHNGNSSITKTDHTERFLKAKEMFQTPGEEATRTPSPLSNQLFTSNSNRIENISYTINNRTSSNSEQHYDFPADAIEQLKKQQRDEVDIKTSNHRIVPSFLPSTIFKRMDHLNTTFVKPTKIERSLPTFIFQEDENQESSFKEEQSKTIENSSLNGKEIVRIELLVL